MAPMSFSSPDSLRKAIVECIAVNAHELHNRIGHIAIGLSADHGGAEQKRASVYDPSSRTLTMLADRVVAGKEGVSLAREITRWHGAQAVRAVMGDSLEKLGVDPEYTEQITRLQDVSEVLNSGYKKSASTALSLQEFCDSRVFHENLEVALGDAPSVPGYAYSGGCYIEKTGDGYMLNIGNDSRMNADLHLLEKLLYEDWYLGECVEVDTTNEEGAHAVGEWAHLFGVGNKETRCRIAIDLTQAKLAAAQEWTGLKFEEVRGERLSDLEESVIAVNEAHLTPDEWGLEVVSGLPAWAKEPEGPAVNAVGEKSVTDVLDGRSIMLDKDGASIKLIGNERMSSGQKGLLERLNAALDEAVLSALDAACARIQEALGVATGDHAAMHFCSGGPQERQVKSLLAAYMIDEIEEQVRCEASVNADAADGPELGI